MVSQDAVKQHVANTVRKADLTTVSAKQIRRTVETHLDLSEGTLSNDKWKGLVKTVIEETIASIERGDPPSQKQAIQSDGEEQLAHKKVKVKRKKSVIHDTPPSSPAKAKVKSPAKVVVLDSPQKEESVDKWPPKKRRKTTAEDDSDSDMSVLNDATPSTSKPRKHKSKDPIGPAKASKPKPSTISKSSTKASGSPAEEEIKNLKSLVFKCGVRRNWSKEIPSTMSSSEQISHLKKLLSSLGMTGRLSVEKAKKIKEERELREELAFIQEGAKSIGEGHRRRHGD